MPTINAPTESWEYQDTRYLANRAAKRRVREQQQFISNARRAINEANTPWYVKFWRFLFTFE